MKRLNRYKTDILIIAIIIILPCLFFWRLITPKMADRMQIATGDFTEQYFPLRAFSAREWVEGRIPLWNANLYGGQPGLADIQAGALYPPHVIQALVLGWSGQGYPLQAQVWQMILHFSIAGVGAYLLGRYWAKRARASIHSARFMGLILSLAFTYSGFLTGFPVQQLTILAVSAWLPWLMWLLSRAMSAVTDNLGWQVSLGRCAWAGLAFALAILAGHPQTTMYIFYLSLAYALFLAVYKGHFQRRGKPAVYLLHWGLIVALGGLISAAQLLPTLKFISHSLRAELSFTAVSAGLPLSELVSILYPGYFGGSPQYVGILPLILIAVALVLARPPLRATVFFWFGVALAALILAFGANTFLYPLFYLFGPGFDAVRQQERVFLVYAFSAAVLSGYGAMFLSASLAPSARQSWATFQRNLGRVGAVALALTGLYIYGAVESSIRGNEVNLFNGVLRHHIFGLIILAGTLLLFALRPRRIWLRWWGMALVALWLIFNLFTVNWQFNLEALSEPPPFTPQGVDQFLLEHTVAQPQPARVASGGFLHGGNSAGAVYNLEDITGNTPLQLADSARFAEEMPSWRYWQLMNVLYVVDERDIDGPGTPRRYQADGLSVYEVSDPFPRARLVYEAINGEDWAILAEDETDLKRVALLPPGVALQLETPSQPGQATVTKSEPGELVVAVETDSNGLLALSNIFYPGWRATVDGVETEIYKTNGIFQGVFVPSGRHEVVLTFAPPIFRWGVWLSALGLVLAGGLIVWGSRRK